MHTKRILYLILVIMLVGLAGNHQSGSAQEPSQADPPQQEMEEALPEVFEEIVIQVEDPPDPPNEGEGMTESNGCMQDIAGFGLNCTANDVQLAGVAYDDSGDPMLEITDPCEYPGDTTTFTATFEVVLTAKERHDIGIYFATDGDPNSDGAVSGECSISTVPYYDEPLWLDLDGTNDPYPGENKPSDVQDLCGDIDDVHSPLYPTITITAVCTDKDGDGNLNLPYCTSWRQPGANELCTRPLNAYPGAPSKCRCDGEFNVPVPVPDAKLKVTKTANPTSVNETGEIVTFTVKVENTGIDPNNYVTLSSLTDDIYGDITDVNNENITSTTCSIAEPIPGAGGTLECSFTAYVEGDANDTDGETDTVIATGTDDNGTTITGEDDATVTFLDVAPAIDVTKTADDPSIPETGQDVIFTYRITNTGVEDVVEVTSIIDDKFGDLLATAEAAWVDAGNTAPIALAAADPDEYFEFTHTEWLASDSLTDHTNRVDVVVEDNEGTEATDYDTETVAFEDIPPEIDVTKSASPESLPEPGGEVTFTYRITNTGVEDVVEVTSIIDNKFGDLLATAEAAWVDAGNTAPIALAAADPDEYFEFTITKTLESNSGEVHTNRVDVIVEDDEGTEATDYDTAMVTFTDVLPQASLTKDVIEALVTFEVEICNGSPASTDTLTLNTLSDDVFGDLLDETNTNIEENNCYLLANDEIPYGQCVTCTFKGTVTTTPHIDTATAGVSDDESNPLSPSGSAFVDFGIYTPLPE